MIKKILYRPFFIRLLHWEYWPFAIIYAPVIPYWIWLCIRARSFFFFNTSNPGIDNGGFLMESKKDIYKLLPNAYYPKTLFFEAGTRITEVLKSIKINQLSYPLIAKPDIGMKGIAVKKLETLGDLVDYALNAKFNFLVQEFISLKNEVGIFYYRYPGEKSGTISGIVSKEFLSVTGDGYSTIAELLRLDKRYVLQLSTLRRSYGNTLDSILGRNEKAVLVPYGNHVRGAKFVDVSMHIDATLTQAIDAICRQIDGFYYGRLDIRYHTWQELREGKNLSIIEVNGAGSEPTHMYDPYHSIFFAWKEIIRHWAILYKISRLNHKKKKQPYMDIRSGLTMLRENKKHVKIISGETSQRA